MKSNLKNKILSYMKYLMIIILCISLGSIAFADSVSYSNIFDAANYITGDGSGPSLFLDDDYNTTDFSISMLRLVFGKVGNILGSDAPINPVISQLFYIFNTGVLVITGILIGYSVLMSTISISEEGSQAFAGKASPFLVFRVVSGAVLLMPTFGGYSAIQLIVLTVVTMGIGFANTAWYMAVDTLAGNIESTDAQQEQETEQDLYKEQIANVLLSRGGSNMDFAIDDPEATVEELIEKTTSSPNADTGTTGSTCIYSSSTAEARNIGGTPSSFTKNYGNPVKMIDIYSMALCQEFTSQTYALLGESSGYTYGYNIQKQDNSTPNVKCCSGTSSCICFGRTDASASQSERSICGAIQFASDEYIEPIKQSVDAAITAVKAIDSSYYDSDSSDLSGIGYTTFRGCNSDTNSSTVDVDAYSCTIGQTLYSMAQTYANNLWELSSSTSSTSGSSGGSSEITSDTTSVQKYGWATAGQYFYDISALTGTSSTISSSVSSEILNPVGTVTKSSCSACKNNTSSPYCCKTTCFAQYSNVTLDSLYNTILYPTGDYEGYSKYYSVAAAKLSADAYNTFNGQLNPNQQPTQTTLTNDPTSVAACKISHYLYKSASKLTNLPSYLTESNVLNPTQILSAFGGSNQVNGNSSVGVTSNTAVSLDYATNNMMVSMLMSLQSLTGLRILTSADVSESTYSGYASRADGFRYDTCYNRLKDFASTPDDCSTAATNFFSEMYSNGCLLLNNKKECQPQKNLDKAGLFGMMYAEQTAIPTSSDCTSNAEYLNPDPIRNMTNVGIVMIKAAVLYYMVTLTQVFQAMVSISLQATAMIAGIKVATAMLNLATFGIAESTFVGIAAIFDQLFKMMFELDKYAIELFLPLGAAIASILFTQGVVLGIYLPFLAFFLYTFGVLGWLVAVIEAMVAAPLIALGMTHPEGHPLLGQAEQSIMLLLSVFLRPIAMVLGLFFAISVSQSIMKLINTGFLYVILDFYTTVVNSGNSTGTIGSKVLLIATLGLLMVYTYVVYSILEMCYGLIYQIPDRLLRWIGGPQENTGQQSAQAASAIKQQTSSTAGEGASGAGQAAGKAPGVGPSAKVGVKASQDEEEDDDDSDSVEDSGGRGAG